MRVLATGATGDVGPAVVRGLIGQDHAVRVLVRPESDRENLVGLNVDFVVGDVTQPDTLRSALDSIDGVVHMAGLHDTWAPRARQFFDVNALGSINVREAAARAGVERLLFVSSGATIGERRRETGTEQSARRGYVLSDYEASKLDAEEALLAASPPPEIVIVNPATVYGLTGRTGLSHAIVSAVSGRLSVSIGAVSAFVYIDDFAAGVVAALTRGRPGERYILAGQNLSRLELLRRAVALVGSRRPIRPASASTWRALSFVYAFQSWITRRRPPVSRDAVRIALHGSRLDGGKAARELDIAYTRLDDGLRATLTALHAEGRIEEPPLEGIAGLGDHPFGR